MSNEDISFVIIPRSYIRDYRNGLLSRIELSTLLYLRPTATPYGIATVNLDSLAQDWLGGSKNYANKILLSLKSKRYLYYQDRTGRRGSFEVHFDQWILPTKDREGKPILKRIEHFFDDELRGTDLPIDHIQAEVQEEVMPLSQRFNSQKEEQIKEDSESKRSAIFRGNDNDTDYENKTDTNPLHDRLPNKVWRTPSEFIPRDEDEEICKYVAIELREKSMSFILGIRKKHGIWLIREAWERLYKETSQGREIEDKAKYFNGIVSQIIDEKLG